MEPKIIEETPLSMAELKEEIKKAKERDKERGASIRVTKVEDYLNNFDVISLSKEKKLKTELEKLEVPRLKEEHVVKIIDLMPKTEDDLKMILQSYLVIVSNENVKKIVNVINSA